MRDLIHKFLIWAPPAVIAGTIGVGLTVAGTFPEHKEDVWNTAAAIGAFLAGPVGISAGIVALALYVFLVYWTSEAAHQERLRTAGVPESPLTITRILVRPIDPADPDGAQHAVAELLNSSKEPVELGVWGVGHQFGDNFLTEQAAIIQERLMRTEAPKQIKRRPLSTTITPGELAKTANQEPTFTKAEWEEIEAGTKIVTWFVAIAYRTPHTGSNRWYLRVYLASRTRDGKAMRTYIDRTNLISI